MTCIDVIFIFSGAFALLCLPLIFQLHKSTQRQKIQLQAVLETQHATMKAELDMAVSDWLSLLELQALKEESKRREVASQLGTVLIEKLMR